MPATFRKENHKVEVWLSPEEFAILERLAKKNKLSYSEYMRLAFVWDAVSDGDIQAMKLTTKRGLQKIWAKLKKQGLDLELHKKVETK